MTDALSSTPETLREISSTRLCCGAAKKTARTYWPVLSAGWPQLIPLYLLQAGFGQFFSYATDYVRQTGREDILFIAIIAGLELVFSLLWSAAWILAVASFAQAHLARAERPRFATVFVERFNALVIEEVRSLAAILWRVPLLILPALIEYVRLSFVPLVVLLDPAYERGEIDALATSRRFARKHFWLLTFTVLFSLVLPWWLEEIAQGDGGTWVWTNPGRVILGWVLTLLINLGTSLFLFFLFRGRQAIPQGPSHDQSPALPMD